MKYLFLFPLFMSFNLFASPVGVTNHRLSDEARVLSLDSSGYFNERHEIGVGLSYTHGFGEGQLMDVRFSSGQHSRGFTLGLGYDFELLNDEGSQPRFSLKPFFEYQKFDATKHSRLGFAPMLRKSLAIGSQEFFPFLALPSGMKLDSATDEFTYFAQFSLGSSWIIPSTQEKLFVTLYGSKNLGSATDEVVASLSWVWK